MVQTRLMGWEQHLKCAGSTISSSNQLQYVNWKIRKHLQRYPGHESKNPLHAPHLRCSLILCDRDNKSIFFEGLDKVASIVSESSNNFALTERKLSWYHATSVILSTGWLQPNLTNVAFLRAHVVLSIWNEWKQKAREIILPFARRMRGCTPYFRCTSRSATSIQLLLYTWGTLEVAGGVYSQEANQKLTKS